MKKAILKHIENNYDACIEQMDILIDKEKYKQWQRYVEKLDIRNCARYSKEWFAIARRDRYCLNQTFEMSQGIPKAEYEVFKISNSGQTNWLPVC